MSSSKSKTPIISISNYETAKFILTAKAKAKAKEHIELTSPEEAVKDIKLYIRNADTSASEVNAEILFTYNEEEDGGEEDQYILKYFTVQSNTEFYLDSLYNHGYDGYKFLFVKKGDLDLIKTNVPQSSTRRKKNTNNTNTNTNTNKKRKRKRTPEPSYPKHDEYHEERTLFQAWGPILHQNEEISRLLDQTKTNTNTNTRDQHNEIIANMDEIHSINENIIKLLSKRRNGGRQVLDSKRVVAFRLSHQGEHMPREAKRRGSQWQTTTTTSKQRKRNATRKRHKCHRKKSLRCRMK